MSEEVAKVNTDLAVPTGAWGSEGASSKDMVIPRLNLMQDLSKLVKSRAANSGDIVNMSTSEVVGGPEKRAEIIPILTFSEFVLYDVIDQGPGKKPKEQYRGKIVCDKLNENLPSEDMVDGRPIRRVRQINVLCLMPKHIDELPFLVSFRKTSTQAGKKLSTHFQSCALRGAPAARTVFNLFTSVQHKDEHSFYAMEVERGREATEAEVAQAFHWYKIWSAGAAKVADDTEAVPF